jgi:hypothetical protein
MSFESRVVSFSQRFLSDRAFQLIVEPALADLQFDEEAGRRSTLANRVAVLRAVAGGLGDDLSRDWYSVFKLTLLSTCYFMFPIALGIQAFKTWSEFFLVASMVQALALVPVVVCFWPPPRSAPPID